MSVYAIRDELTGTYFQSQPTRGWYGPLETAKLYRTKEGAQRSIGGGSLRLAIRANHNRQNVVVEVLVTLAEVPES